MIAWFRNIFRRRQAESDAALRTLRDKFNDFQAILENNNQVLKTLSDMEEKAQGEYLLDMNYVRAGLAEIRAGVREIVERMISLGGDVYAPLRDRYAAIDADIARLLPETRPVEQDDFVVPLDALSGSRAFSVGSKSAQLGEMRALGLPVPDGFAVSAWAYKHFVAANDLQTRISQRLGSLDIKRYEDLERIGREIRDMITSAEVPDDLAQAIREQCAELEQRSGSTRFALRSSAIGEDTQFSFAGQYATFLNVRADDVIDRYREVLASKFTPKAIYYFLSHDLTEADLAMGVGCIAMVDAVASGVAYSRDPVHPEDGCTVINAVFGLGPYLVDGTLTPDVFRVSRADGVVVESHLAVKPVRLVLDEDGGTRSEAVPEVQRQAPSLGEPHLTALAGFAEKLEAHYDGPQDIEWAVDREGRLVLLQTRPLRVIETKPKAAGVDVSTLDAVLTGGVTVCPGAGGGPVFHANSTESLPRVPDGAVLVAPNPFAGLITVLDKVSALVVATGGVASHMATIAREYRVPMLAGLEDAGRLPDGKAVTVDATEAVVYDGVHPDLISARRPEYELFEDTEIFRLLEKVLARISPLSLIDPRDPGFVPENCRTFHDITRLAHQRAMEEMFSTGEGLEHKERIGLSLRSDIPLPVVIIYLDQTPANTGQSRWVPDQKIASKPMQVFWNGIKEEGWPSPTRSADLKGFMSVMATTMTRPEPSAFRQTSFAILGKEYMILSLHLGYHFTTIEAMCSADVSKNYIRMQYKEGGASLERRVRRIKLITDILSAVGFEHATRGDFLDTMVSYQDEEAISERLFILGRMTMMTKQLDMALSNDAIAEWYTGDFMKKLGLAQAQGADS